MKSTSNVTGGTKTFIPAMLGISLTLASVWGMHAAYGAQPAEPSIVVVDTPPSQTVAAPTPTPRPPTPKPAVPKPVVATVPAPQAPAPPSSPAPAPVTVTTPTVKKVKVVATPSRRTRAS